MSDFESDTNIRRGIFGQGCRFPFETDGLVLQFPTSQRFSDEPARLREFDPFRRALRRWVDIAHETEITTTYIHSIGNLIRGEETDPNVQSWRIKAAYSASPTIPAFESTADNTPLCVARLNEGSDDVSVMPHSSIVLGAYHDGQLIPASGFTQRQLEAALISVQELVSAGLVLTLESRS